MSFSAAGVARYKANEISYRCCIDQPAEHHACKGWLLTSDGPPAFMRCHCACHTTPAVPEAVA